MLAIQPARRPRAPKELLTDVGLFIRMRGTVVPLIPARAQIQMCRGGPAASRRYKELPVPLHHALDEPERSRDDDANGARGNNAPAQKPVSLVNERKQRRHRQDDERLPDLDAEVEGEERPAERRAWQIHLTQNVRKAEPVDETETKSEDKTPVALFPLFPGS